MQLLWHSYLQNCEKLSKNKKNQKEALNSFVTATLIGKKLFIILHGYADRIQIDRSQIDPGEVFSICTHEFGFI